MSASTSPVSAGTITNSVRPAISDTTPEVGQALTATSGTWNLADGTYAYQWLANGTAITGATTNAYAPVAGDVGT